MNESCNPVYPHDCDKCVFLGTFMDHDLYHCMQGGEWPTVVARYGNAGPDYRAGVFGREDAPELYEAESRARAKGLPLKHG